MAKRLVLKCENADGPSNGQCQVYRQDEINENFKLGDLTVLTESIYECTVAESREPSTEPFLVLSRDSSGVANNASVLNLIEDCWLAVSGCDGAGYEGLKYIKKERGERVLNKDAIRFVESLDNTYKEYVTVEFKNGKKKVLNLPFITLDLFALFREKCVFIPENVDSVMLRTLYALCRKDQRQLTSTDRALLLPFKSTN